MLVKDLINKLDNHSPIDAAMDWDNVGLLVGDYDKEVKKIYIALDATDEVIEHAIDANADLLLTHHPLIFSGLKRITADHFIGRRIMKLIRHDISYVAFHTNFDVFGMGDVVAKRLELRDCVPLDVTYGDDEGIGRIGDAVTPVSLKQLAKDVKDKFDLSAVNVYGDTDKIMKRIAVCPGSGKSDIDNAVAGGADVLITGDIGHHDGIDSVAKGMAIIDAGHYGLEHLFIDYMSEFLMGNNTVSDFEIYKEPIENPYTVI
ncbi:MAG: Nif3-like dinuclear metal center hexameric protein [Lachnospiraceae bacterium]|nr:Nif3-like dinuclear metal center hexameric protein [Lachnospiraceae bacterium]